MLKRNITFEDFEGETQTETYYFSLSKPELLSMSVEKNVGLGKILQQIVDARNDEELIKRFQDLILRAYGVKSEDGKRFIKNDQVREEFSQTEAYNVLFMELATDDKKAVEFLIGVIPKDLQEEAAKMDLRDKVAEKLGTENLPAPPAPPAQ